jgi:secondary thiamine-phosphate synthase enzyme
VSGVKQHQTTLTVATRGPGFSDVTQQVRSFVRDSGIEQGLLTVFVPHTSVSLLIQENADPDVLRDLTDAFARLAPRGAQYRHRTEGPDDMPAHIRSALTQSSISIPVQGGAPVFGVWQALYLFEHRDAPHERELVLHVIGQ